MSEKVPCRADSAAIDRRPTRHQPTPESIRRAEAASTTGVDDILNRAKALDAEGKTKECMDLVATAKLRLQ